MQGTFALRATLGTCLAKLKALDRTALAMFPLLFHSCTAPLGGDGDEDLYSAAQPTTGFDDMVQCTERMHRAVDVWGLHGCHAWPPLINGNQVLIRSRASLWLCACMHACILQDC